MNVSVTIILDTRRIKKKNSKYPVKLRVTFERASQYYQTIFDLSTDDYEKLSASRISTELQQVREKLKEIQRTAESAAKELEPFSFRDFEKCFILNNPLFRERKTQKVFAPIVSNEFNFSEYEKKFPILKEKEFQSDTILSVYLSYIKKLLQEGRIGTAFSCYHSYNSLKKFRGNMKIADITVSYLNQYEQWMRNAGNSKSTIGMYLRALRTIFNEAIAAGIIKKEKYPFGRRKYQIPTSRNIKKALDLEAIKKIYYYESEFDSEKKARDFWLFCYFGNGMNPKDVAYLKFKNIQGEYLIFERAKTERTTRTDPKPITVYITEDMWVIINRWGNKDKNPNNYIFPIIEHGLSALRQYELIQLFIRFINDWMAKICEHLELEKKATTITTRHSFSTIMKRSGASTEFIQEALGHTDLKTTENYLDSFEKEVKKEFAGRLVAFKNENMTKQVS